jgi:hypothetical protein
MASKLPTDRGWMVLVTAVLAIELIFGRAYDPFLENL